MAAGGSALGWECQPPLVSNPMDQEAQLAATCRLSPLPSPAAPRRTPLGCGASAAQRPPGSPRTLGPAPTHAALAEGKQLGSVVVGVALCGLLVMRHQRGSHGPVHHVVQAPVAGIRSSRRQQEGCPAPLPLACMASAAGTFSASASCAAASRVSPAGQADSGCCTAGGRAAAPAPLSPSPTPPWLPPASLLPSPPLPLGTSAVTPLPSS